MYALFERISNYSTLFSEVYIIVMFLKQYIFVILLESFWKKWFFLHCDLQSLNISVVGKEERQTSKINPVSVHYAEVIRQNAPPSNSMDRCAQTKCANFTLRIYCGHTFVPHNIGEQFLNIMSWKYNYVMIL